MILYEFDTDERMIHLVKNLEYVTTIKNSIADDRSKYRMFANDLSIDFKALQSCCDTFQRNLLIDIYTYAEQLIKNFYYEVMEKDTVENLYIRSFINKKLDPEKFSPDVKYANIEKGIRQELIPEFKFAFNVNKEEIQIYNELINARHIYAHRGRFSFEANYSDVIEVIKYITSELEMVVDNGVNYRIEYQNKLKELRGKLNELVNLINCYLERKNDVLKRKIVDKIKEYRILCEEFLCSYNTYLMKSDLMRNIREKIYEISGCDLRKFSKTCDNLLTLKVILDVSRLSQM